MKSVFVGLSGGVDSSVAAALLKRQGYLVTGVYMKNWTADVAGVACPWKQDLADARAVAAALDVPFQVFDFQSEYKRHVVDAMVADYASGRTPNPDILCNQKIKFDQFLQAALASGADYIATGHYAGINEHCLTMAADPDKDQSYFLYRIPKRALSRALFPLAELSKTEVRQIARDLGLPTAAKPDSQGICFVGEVGLRQFLRQYVDASPGPVVLAGTAQSIGQHEGALFYTLGQRHGLGIGGGTPYYVTGKDMAANTVFVTEDPQDDKLAADTFSLTHAHWLTEAPDFSREYQIRTRYRAPLVTGHLSSPTGRVTVTLDHPDRAVTPGQSAVIYDGRVVVGGGIIA